MSHDGPPQLTDADDLDDAAGPPQLWGLWFIAAFAATAGLIVLFVGFGEPFFEWDTTDADLQSTRGQVLGACLILGAALVTALLTWRRVHATENQTLALVRQARAAAETLEQTKRRDSAQLELDRRGQLSTRFSRAVEHLGHQTEEVRLGGLYELEALMRADEDTYGTAGGAIIAAVIRSWTMQTSAGP